MSAANQRDEKGQNPISIAAAQASAAVITVITQHKNGRNKTDKAALETAIKACLRKEFAKLRSDADKEKLRKKLALSLHSDKLRNDEDIYLYLTSINAQEVPFDCLQTCQAAPGMVSQVALSPTAWIQRVLGYIQRIEAHKAALSENAPAEIRSQILQNREQFREQIPTILSQASGVSTLRLATKQAQQTLVAQLLTVRNRDTQDQQVLEQIQAFLAQTDEEVQIEINAQVKAQQQSAKIALDTERAELSHIAPGLLFVLGMGGDLDRYVQPFRFLGNLIMWPLNFALVLVIIASCIPSLILTAFRKILGFFINILTAGEYNKRIDAYETSQILLKFAAAMEALRQQNPQLLEATDDEVFEAILPSLQKAPIGAVKSRKEYNATLKKQVPLTLSAFLQGSFGALWHSLTNRPKGAGWPFLWVLTWIPRLAIGLALGITGAAVATIGTIVGTVLTLTTLLVAFLVRTLTLLTLNLPLYLLVDFPRAVAKFCCGGDRNPGRSPEPQGEFRPARSLTMSGVRKGKNSDDEDEASVSYQPPYGSKKRGSNSATSTDQNSSNARRISLTATSDDSEID